jgi:phosphoribosylformylglycinamidine cyclo-ligase
MTERSSNPSSCQSSYKEAGVDIAAGERAVELIAGAVRSTYGEAVLSGIGAFGGLFDLSRSERAGRAGPVLVASTDSVGTKTRLAAALGRFDTIGHDIVNHCLNDILVQGATPLFFLDYFAAGALEPERVAAVVGGVAAACREAGCALLGGETAELPGVYAAGEFDLVGTVVGAVARAEMVDGREIRSGDRILALMSGGLQTNGYSLARRILEGRYGEALGDGTVGEALLRPHRSYLRPVRALLDLGLVRGMAHVTGGGMPGNLPRVLPAGLGAVIEADSWPVPAIFRLIQAAGGVAGEEMRRVFNLGAGYLVVVRPEDVAEALACAGESVFPIGTVVEGLGVQFQTS